MSYSLTLVLFIVVIVLLLFALTSLMAIKKRDLRLEEGRYFESSQGPIHYYIEGKKGPAVLFIHGIGASAFTWRNVTCELKKHFQCVRVDLWGFGFSSKDNFQEMTLDTQIQVLEELMDELGFTEYYVVGHSMGGHIGLWLKYNDPRVKKYVGIAPAAHPDLVSVLLTKNRWIANWTPLVMNPRLIHHLIKRILIDPTKLNDEMVDGYFQPYLDPKAHLCFAAALNMIRDPRVYEHLGDIQGDVLVIWGEDDRVIPTPISQKIRNRLKCGHHISNPRSGHLPMEDHPELINKQILSHLKS